MSEARDTSAIDLPTIKARQKSIEAYFKGASDNAAMQKLATILMDYCSDLAQEKEGGDHE